MTHRWQSAVCSSWRLSVTPRTAASTPPASCQHRGATGRWCQAGAGRGGAAGPGTLSPTRPSTQGAAAVSTLSTVKVNKVRPSLFLTGLLLPASVFISSNYILLYFSFLLLCETQHLESSRSCMRKGHRDHRCVPISWTITWQADSKYKRRCGVGADFRNANIQETWARWYCVGLRAAYVRPMCGFPYAWNSPSDSHVNTCTISQFKYRQCVIDRRLFAAWSYIKSMIRCTPRATVWDHK